MAKYFNVSTDKPATSYKCGEEITFTVQARENCQNIGCKYIYWEISTDDGVTEKGYGSCENDKPLILKSKLSRPGFVRLNCTARLPDNCPDPSFDFLEAGAGAEIEKLTYCDTIPDDFDEYWGEIDKLVNENEWEVTLFKEITGDVREGYKLYDVRINAPEGRPASGLISIPDKEGKFPMTVIFNGYSVVGATPHYTVDGITATFNAHGIENNEPMVEALKKYGDELNGYGFNETENKSNMTTYWRNVMIRDLIGTKFAKTLPQWDGENLTCHGGSQGAFQAVTVAAHDKDVTFLDIYIPWFCNLGGVNKGYMAGWLPKLQEGLRYFDTVAQGTRVKCPTHIRARIGDYCCPPSTTITLYNSMNCEKSMKLILAGNHSYNPLEEKSLHFYYSPENPKAELKLGKYRHFKGGEYEVLSIGFDSETEQEVVIYKALYGEGKIWVRPKHEFLERTLREGKFIKRFEYIG